MASNLTLKRNCRHYDEIFITGCTGSCQNDNYRCSQWWKFSQNDDISVSVLGRLSCTSHGGQRNNHQHCFLVQIVTGKLLVFVSVCTRNMLITYLLYGIYIWFVIYLTMVGMWRLCRCKAAFTRDATGSATAARQPRRKNRNIGILQPGVRCCFWLNLSSDLTLHKSCLNFWLKSEIRLKSETAPHPRSVYTATRCTQQTRDCCEPGRRFKFELIIAARHMLSWAVASVFLEEHRPQKLPIHGLYAGVARNSCLPCKRFCRAASRAAACRSPVALLVAPRVNVP